MFLFSSITNSHVSKTHSLHYLKLKEVSLANDIEKAMRIDIRAKHKAWYFE